MATLSAADIASHEGRGDPWKLHGVMAAELGPYGHNIRFRIRAFTLHVGGGDSSSAWMKFYYDGDQVGEDTDRKFNTALLESYYDLYLTAGNTAALRIETGNDGPTVDKKGFDLWWQYA